MVIALKYVTEYFECVVRDTHTHNRFTVRDSQGKIPDVIRGSHRISFLRQ